MSAVSPVPPGEPRQSRPDPTLADLAALPRWVAWQTEGRGPKGKPTKVPYAPKGGKAKADDPATWSTLEAAESRAGALPKLFGAGGTGLELGDHGGLAIGGIDLDTCRDPAGTLAPWAGEVLARFPTYAEVSPSGAGVKLLFTYDPADGVAIRQAMGTATGRKWSRKGGDHPPGIELYISGRFFAVTGERHTDAPAELRRMALADLLWLIREAGPAMAAGDDDAEADAAIAAPEHGPAPERHLVGNDKSRSALAFRVGCQARRGGSDFDGMCAAIRDNPDTADWYAEKGTADGSRELHRIWDKADPFTGDLILFGRAPLESARQFIGRLHTTAGIRTLLHQNASFYTWQGSQYIERAQEEMRAALYAFLDGAQTINDQDQLVPFNPTRNKVLNVLEATAAEAQVSRQLRPPAWLDGTTDPAPGDVIACRNGLLRLPQLETRNHTPAFFTLNALPFDYDPKAPKPKQWLAFLNTLWPDDAEAITTLQELFGLCLTADTSHQKAFLLIGPRRSGKGTIARVLTLLLGAANVCGPTLSSLSTNFGLAPLIGKRLAIISDARLGGKADQQVIVERLLAITGEDGISIDRKFRDAWTGKLDVRFVVLTNELPRLTDASGALASRFVILTMTRSFYGQEDRGLLAKLMPELPGILLWALAGWKRLAERGHFVPPASSAAAQRDLEDLGSPIGAFLRDCCQVGQGHAVESKALYRAWCGWCKEHGRDKPGTSQSFGKELNAAIPGLKVAQPRDEQGKQQRYYEGVGFDPGWVTRDDTRIEALCSQSPEYDPDDPGPQPYH